MDRKKLAEISLELEFGINVISNIKFKSKITEKEKLNLILAFTKETDTGITWAIAKWLKVNMLDVGSKEVLEKYFDASVYTIKNKSFIFLEDKIVRLKDFSEKSSKLLQIMCKYYPQDLETIKRLLANNSNIVDALFVDAAFGGNLELVRFLLKQENSVRRFYQALNVAASMDNERLFNLLVLEGPLTPGWDQWDSTAKDRAKYHDKYSRLVELKKAYSE